MRNCNSASPANTSKCKKNLGNLSAYICRDSSSRAHPCKPFPFPGSPLVARSVLKNVQARNILVLWRLSILVKAYRRHYDIPDLHRPCRSYVQLSHGRAPCLPQLSEYTNPTDRTFWLNPVPLPSVGIQHHLISNAHWGQPTSILSFIPPIRLLTPHCLDRDPRTTQTWEGGIGHDPKLAKRRRHVKQTIWRITRTSQMFVCCNVVFLLSSLFRNCVANACCWRRTIHIVIHFFMIWLQKVWSLYSLCIWLGAHFALKMFPKIEMSCLKGHQKNDARKTYKNVLKLP